MKEVIFFHRNTAPTPCEQHDWTPDDTPAPTGYRWFACTKCPAWKAQERTQ